jgi:DNA polymerase sigma
VTAILDFAAVNRRPGSFNVDIGINNTDGLRAITIVNEYLSKMPALRSLIFIVKGFLSQRNLNNAAYGGLGSYAVILMCISFLQVRRALYRRCHLTSDSSTPASVRRTISTSRWRQSLSARCWLTLCSIMV